MAKTIKSWNDFQRVIENRIQLALQQTQDVVAQCLHESLNEYYKEKVLTMEHQIFHRVTIEPMRY